MEIKLNVTVDLSDNAKNFLSAVLTGGQAKVASKEVATKAAPKVAKPAIDEPEAEEETAPVKKVTKAVETKPAKSAETAKKPAIKKPAKEEAPAFEDMNEDEQLEAIRTIVTRHSKKGKTKDIKALLAAFGVERAGDLDKTDYADAFDALTRYDGGESIDDILDLG